MAVSHNASKGADDKIDPWAGRDPRDMAEGIKREAENLRYQRHAVGRRQDRIQSPDKRRDQKTLDRGEVISKARHSAKRGHLNKESRQHQHRHKHIQRFPREAKEGYEPFKPEDGVPNKKTSSHAGTGAYKRPNSGITGFPEPEKLGQK